MSEHFHEPDLWPYVVGELDAESRALVDAHLPACGECSRTLAQMRAFESGFSADAVWQVDEPVLPGPALRPSSRLVAFAIEHAEEEERARSAIPALRDAADGDLRAQILGDPALQTLAGVRSLLELARNQLERAPKRSLQIATIARDVLIQIQPGRYPATAQNETEALLWKETSNALRFLGDLQGAGQAIERAAGILDACPASHHVRASVDLARAILRLETERFDEARTLAEGAGEVFLDHGDTPRWIHARLVVAATLYSMGDIRASREVLFSLLRPAQDEGDAESLARIFNDIGRASVDLGEPEVAITYLHQALNLYGELGIETERIRTRWAIGRLMIGSGKEAEGIDRLRTAQEEFEALGMEHDAALVALERVEALLATGQPGDIRSICERLIDRFTRGGALNSALTGLAYLRDAVHEGRATPRVASHVRNHLEALRTEPERLFLPLPDEQG